MNWRTFLSHRIAAISLGFLILISLVALAAPLVTRHSYEEQDIEHRLETPSATYWMGTDTLGRDVYSRVVYGARVSLTIGVLTALVSLILGTVVGALAGYWGGWLDQLIMRLVDVFYIFPSILFAILIGLWVGQGLSGILIAISWTSWITQSRLVRAQFLQAREMLYVESARAIGVPTRDVIFKHILPNLWGPIIVSLTVQIPANIMAESFLSFIGLGIQPPYSSWGTLASEGFRAMKSYPHLILFPGGILFLTLLAFNFLGDGLRDGLDTHTGAPLE